MSFTRKKKTIVALALLTLLTLGLTVSCSRPATSEKQEAVREKPFYEGATFTFIVSTKPGGGYDTYGRLLARYMQKYLPGSTFVVKNVPGAGQIIGTNELYNSTPDGLTVGITNTIGIITAQFRKEEGVKYDVNKFTWLATVAQAPQLLLIGTNSEFKDMSLEEIKKTGKKIVLASPGLGTSGHIILKAIQQAFLPKADIVTGYSGQDEQLAIMRGEVDGTVGSYDSWKNMLEQGAVKPVIRVGRLDVGAPLASDLAPEGEAKQILEALDYMTDVTRAIAAPPGLPEDRTKVLRDVIAKCVQDQEMLAEAQKAGLMLDYRSGEETAEIINKIMGLPSNVIEALNAAAGQ